MEKKVIEERKQTILKSLKELNFEGLAEFMRGTHSLYHQMYQLHKDDSEWQTAEIEKEAGRKNVAGFYNFDVSSCIINRVCELLLEYDESQTIPLFRELIVLGYRMTSSYALEQLVVMNTEQSKKEIDELLNHKDEEITAKVLAAISKAEMIGDYRDTIVARAKKEISNDDVRREISYDVVILNDPEITDIVSTMFSNASSSYIRWMLSGFEETGSLQKNEQMIMRKAYEELHKCATEENVNYACTLVEMIDYIAKIKTKLAKCFFMTCFCQWLMAYQNTDSEDNRRSYGNRMHSIMVGMVKHGTLDSIIDDFQFSVNTHDHEQVIELANKALESMHL